ncbi:MAG TPA: DUF1566 domain-containing protein [Desulfuromonadales bacterium]|nr:DUF1566 domain-containing protein [Desulfuromonadales bacterium]
MLRLSLAAVLLLLPLSTFAAPPAPVMQTGQTTCFNNDGNTLSCAGTGLDGDVKAGVAWPTPRFTDNKNGTLTDSLTGLTWLKDAYCYKDGTMFATLTRAKALKSGTCGLTDDSVAGSWRVPTIAELRTLQNFGSPLGNNDTWLISQGFSNAQNKVYWSSTNNGTQYGFVADLGSNHETFRYKDAVEASLFVKGSSTSSTAPVMQTGQTTCSNSVGNSIPCSGTGQNGELRTGVAWPNPRFSDTGSGIIVDNLTGIGWSKNANAPSPDKSTCAPGADKTYPNALSHIACLNTNKYLGFSSWRLPSIKELQTLYDYSESSQDNISWLTSQGVSNINASNNSYWSSTNNLASGYTMQAYMYDIMTAYTDTMNRNNNTTATIWPVCAGNFTLNLTTSGNGSGSVATSNGSVSLNGTNGSISYTYCQTITLTATPTSGSSFAGWSGDCSGSSSCTLTMDKARNVTAKFDKGGNGSPTPTQTGMVGDGFDVLTTDSGTAKSLSLTASVKTGASDIGKPGKVFFVLVFMNNIFLHDGSKLVLYKGGDVPNFFNGSLQAQTSLLSFSNLDLSGLVGLSLYGGYGTSIEEMLAAGRFKQFYTIK